MLDKIFFFVLASFTIGSLGQIFRVGGFNLYLYDLVMLGANLYFFLFFLKKKKFYINSPLILFSFFSAFSLTVTLFSLQGYGFSESLMVLSFWLRFNLIFILSFFIFNLLKFNFLSLESFKNNLIYNFYLLTFLNLIQYLFLKDISFMNIYGFDPHTTRLTGFFLDPNFMGFYLISYLFSNEFFLKNKYLSYISIVSLFLTNSRSALLTLLIFLIFYIFKNFKKSLILFCISIFLFLITDMTSRLGHLSASNDSSSLRITSWENAISIYNSSSFWGIGFSNYRNYLIGLNLVGPEFYYTNSSNYSDSSLLSVLAFSGIFGTFIFLCFLLSYTKNYLNMVLLTLVFFNSFIINSLFYPVTAFLIFMFLNFNLYRKN